MIEQDAPEADIDAYIAEEGITLDMLKGQAQPEERPLSTEYIPSPDEANKEFAGKFPNVYGATVRGLQKAGGLLGLDKPAETIGKTAAYLTRPSNVTPQMAQEAGLRPTAGEIGGAGLQIGATVLPYGRLAKGATQLATKAGLPLAKYVGTGAAGAAGGYAFEAGEKIAKGESPTPGLTTAIGAVIPPAAEGIVSKLKSKPLDVLLSSTVKEGINKGIRPSVQSTGKTSVQGKAYYEKAQKAVETIVENKPNLEFVKDGQRVTGTLPKSLTEFSDAIGQTKQSIFAQYDALAQASPQYYGSSVDLTPVAKELESVINNKVLNDLNPSHGGHGFNVIEYAKTMSKSFSNRGTYTTTEAQEAVTTLNNSLKAFYSNPSYETASKAAVDAMVANKMRQSLDDVIEKTSGAGYQELKNTYGALKAIEKDVNHRATVDARKNIKGLIDFSDLYSGPALVNGILTMSPTKIASGATVKAIALWHKHINNPNHIITKMFDKTEKIISKKATPVRPKPATRFPGDIIADTISK